MKVITVQWFILTKSHYTVYVFHSISVSINETCSLWVIAQVYEIQGHSDILGVWSTDEHKLFLSGLSQYGKDWEAIQTMVAACIPFNVQIPTRTVCQVRTHAQKYFSKLEKEVPLYVAVTDE